MRIKVILFVVSLPRATNTSRKSYYIAIMILYLLRMLKLTYCPKNGLILKCLLMAKLEVLSKTKNL